MKHFKYNGYVPAFYIAVILLFASCKQETVKPDDLGKAYFPLRLKSMVSYNVDSTVYNDFNNTITTYQFKIKDTVVGLFTDLEGKAAYKIERYKKTGTNPWVFQKVVSRNELNNRAEEFIDNRRYVRLVFPPQLQRKWNGNLYNDMPAWNYTITSLDAPLRIGINNLDSTLAISQYNEVNLIREDIYSETYAKHIGLVIKEVRAIDKDITTGKIKKGTIYKMQLEQYK